MKTGNLLTVTILMMLVCVPVTASATGSYAAFGAGGGGVLPDNSGQGESGANIIAVAPAIADVKVELGNPVNYEGDMLTRVGNLGGGTRFGAFMHFDLSMIPADANILWARLVVSVADPTGNTPSAVLVRRVNGPWDPMVISGTVLPPVGPIYAGALPPAAGNAVWLVTSLVNDWLSTGVGNFGLALVPGAAPSWSYYFDAIEAGAATAPRIVVSYN